MYKLLFINLLLTFSLWASEILATVNGKPITKEDVDKFLSKSIPGAKYSLLTPEQKQKVLEKLINKALYLEVAKKEGIENSSEFHKALEKAKENIMLDIWMKNRLENIRVSDDEVWNYYVSRDKKFHRSAMARARHILVSTRKEAKEIIQELENSSNLEQKFIELARTRSTGPSAKNGGDLGWFRKDQMFVEFSNATFALKKGQITHIPVHTSFGWHVIYLIDKKPAGKIEFEKVKEEIRNSLKLQKFQENLEILNKKLKKSAKISVK
jgi:parvulin-like peptidyl-prolyl isomerase